MRENAAAKADRLLVHGRVVIYRADARRVLAHVRGDSAEVYDAGFERGAWYCNCPALGRCSHLIAVQRVTLRPGSAMRLVDESTPAA